MKIKHYYIEGFSEDSYPGFRNLPEKVDLACQMESDYVCADNLSSARAKARKMEADYDVVAIGKVIYNSINLCEFWSNSFNGKVGAEIEWLEEISETGVRRNDD